MAERLKLDELEDYVEEIPDEVQEVTLFPPENDTITDEESEDEDEVNVNYVPNWILQSEIEVRLSSSQSPIEEGEKTESANPTPVIGNFPTTSSTSCFVLEPDGRKHFGEELVQDDIKKQKTYDSRLVETDWHSDSETFIGNSGRGDIEEMCISSKVNKTPVQWFETVFTEELFCFIAEMSNIYALQRNHNLKLTVDELKVYMAVLICTGYLQPQYIRMYWEKKPDTHNKGIANAIRRNRFIEIHKYLHLCDNLNLPENDKFGKTRQYFTMLSNSFINNFRNIASTHISIGKTMIPYYGKHESKQHIFGKPVRFGYKLWSATTRLGYLVCFEPYQGAKADRLPNQDVYDVGGAVVIELAKRLPKDFRPYNLYFDSFFTSYGLLSTLSYEGFGGTGSIIESKLENCPLVDSKILKKQNRGCFSFKNKENLLVVKWHDNNVISVVTNCHKLLPIQKVWRFAFSEGKRQKILLDCPSVIQKYNKYVGGVDRFNENILGQRIGLKGKKWWFPLFTFGIDAACHNAWQLMKQCSEEKMTYCEFRRSIVQTYLGKYGTPPQKDQNCGVPALKRLPQEIRTSGDTESHTKALCSQRRCSLCHQRTRIMCGKCKVPLHIHCWYQFHNG